MPSQVGTDYDPGYGPAPKDQPTGTSQNTPPGENWEHQVPDPDQGSISGQTTSTGGSGKKKKCTLKVIYYANGDYGDPPDTTTQIYNGPKEPVTLSEIVKNNEHGMERAGYYFIGWATSASGNLAYYPGDTIGNTWNNTGSGTKTFKLYAKWVNSGVFIYDPGPHSNELYYLASSKSNGTETTLRGEGTFTRLGYTLIGWSDDQNYSGPIPWSGNEISWVDDGGVIHFATCYLLSERVTPTSSAVMVLYPIWQANTYTITVHPNGGTGSDVEIQTAYDAEFTMPSTFDFSKNPYHITLLNEHQDGTGSSWYLGWSYIFKRTKNVDLYAVWEGNEYTVSYTDGNGNVVHQSTASYGRPFYTDRIPYPESRVYNTFMGWKADDNTVLTKQDAWFDSYSYGSDPTWTLSRDLTINPIWSPNYSFGKIFYGGRYSNDLGIYVEEPPSYTWPEYPYTHKVIAGKNGDFLIDPKRYENVKKVYKISAYDGSDFYTVAKKVSSWLNRQSTEKDKYFRLEDSYEPDVYRRAVYEESNELENILYRAGKAEITFSCKPQKFLLSGDRFILIDESGQTITNPTDHNALPIIKLYGYGSVFINGVKIEINDNRNVVTFDAETFKAVDNEGVNMNGWVFAYDTVFLKPGVNVITFDDTIFGLTIQPRWWII